MIVEMVFQMKGSMLEGRRDEKVGIVFRREFRGRIVMNGCLIRGVDKIAILLELTWFEDRFETRRGNDGV